MKRRPPAIHVERKGTTAVASAQGRDHERYEDRFRLLCEPVPVVCEVDRGEILAVFDGIGGAPEGMAAAQHMADSLVSFFKSPNYDPPTAQALHGLLMTANQEIYDWGLMPESNRPLGGCAGTIAWLHDDRLYLFHAGDTVAWVKTFKQWTACTTVHGTGKMLHRYFGLGSTLEIDLRSQALDDVERILLVSDGITKVMSQPEITALVDEERDIGRAVEKLASRAQVKGSGDDITALIVEQDL